MNQSKSRLIYRVQQILFLMQLFCIIVFKTLLLIIKIQFLFYNTTSCFITFSKLSINFLLLLTLKPTSKLSNKIVQQKFISKFLTTLSKITRQKSYQQLSLRKTTLTTLVLAIYFLSSTVNTISIFYLKMILIFTLDLNQ